MGAAGFKRLPICGPFAFRPAIGLPAWGWCKIKRATLTLAGAALAFADGFRGLFAGHGVQCFAPLLATICDCFSRVFSELPLAIPSFSE
jgi:hypothetical protein